MHSLTFFTLEKIPYDTIYNGLKDNPWKKNW
jgi:hypothetical protein